MPKVNQMHRIIHGTMATFLLVAYSFTIQAQDFEDALSSTFSYQVKFDSTSEPVMFQEVSGLDLESKVIEYRPGNEQELGALQLPDISSYRGVTMKKGIIGKE